MINKNYHKNNEFLKNIKNYSDLCEYFWTKDNSKKVLISEFYEKAEQYFKHKKIIK